VRSAQAEIAKNSQPDRVDRHRVVVEAGQGLLLDPVQPQAGGAVAEVPIQDNEIKRV
jgi:hypothetical protein